jgi:hypothetical protein
MDAQSHLVQNEVQQTPVVAAEVDECLQQTVVVDLHQHHVLQTLLYPYVLSMLHPFLLFA